MNKVYKVIWSKVKNCYVVVSELAKRHTKSSGTGRKVAGSLLAGVFAFSLFTSMQVFAADTTAGGGDGVAFGTGSIAPKAENVALGKGATISYSNGASKATGDIVVGSGAGINNYVSQGGSIAIGSNAKIENMAGQQERIFSFGQTEWKQKVFLAFITEQPFRQTRRKRLPASQ